MVGIQIYVETEKNEKIEMKTESGSMSILLMKLPIKMKKFVKKIENSGKRILSTNVVFIGGWNMTVLNQFCKGLDKRGVNWSWEL